MSTDYIVVDWVANKFYTLMENTKNVKLNDLVTCTINNTKDNGIVMFVGSEKDCKHLLLQLRKDQLKKSKNIETENNNKVNVDETRNYLNENIIYDNDSNDLNINGLEFNNNIETYEHHNHHHHHQQQIQQTHNLDVQNLVENKLDDDDDLIVPSNKRRKITRFKNDNINKMVLNGAKPCSQCDCCQILQRQMHDLNERLHQLENASE
jgi:hypothetical protein